MLTILVRIFLFILVVVVPLRLTDFASHAFQAAIQKAEEDDTLVLLHVVSIKKYKPLFHRAKTLIYQLLLRSKTRLSFFRSSDMVTGQLMAHMNCIPKTLT